mgnify:FL=1|tara:strand:+ start:612 stop:896 length:285 start_codon:yes stop_codon:yes gene_type:complete
MRLVTVKNHQIVAEKGKTAKYYAKSPEARAKKKEYDKKYHATEARKKYRAFLNKMRRRAGRYGNGDGMDYDHTEKKFMSAKRNRSKDRPKKKKK